MAGSEDNLDTPGHVSDVERWAAEISGNDPIKARSLIVGWSVFTGENGYPVSIESRTWAKVSPGWTRQIWYRARKAYADYKAQPNLELEFEEPTRMPQDGPENHFEGEPF